MPSFLRRHGNVKGAFPSPAREPNPTGAFPSAANENIVMPTRHRTRTASSDAAHDPNSNHNRSKKTTAPRRMLKFGSGAVLQKKVKAIRTSIARRSGAYPSSSTSSSSSSSLSYQHARSATSSIPIADHDDSYHDQVQLTGFEALDNAEYGFTSAFDFTPLVDSRDSMDDVEWIEMMYPDIQTVPSRQSTVSTYDV